jgi:26S proteasome regulatory subunit N12
VLIDTIRSEIASCSEKAYTSLPISNAKNLLFLDSEGAVVKFANEVRIVAFDFLKLRGITDFVSSA